MTLQDLPINFPAPCSVLSIYLRCSKRFLAIIENQVTYQKYIAVFNLNFKTKTLSVYKFAKVLEDEEFVKVYVLDDTVIGYTDDSIYVYGLDYQHEDLISWRQTIEVPDEQQFFGPESYARLEGNVGFLSYIIN